MRLLCATLLCKSLCCSRERLPATPRMGEATQFLRLRQLTNMQKRPHQHLRILAYHGLRALRRKEQLKCRFPFFWRAAFAVVRIVLLPAPAIDTMDDIEKVSAVQEASPAPATPAPGSVRLASNHSSPSSPPLDSPPRAGRHA